MDEPTKKEKRSARLRNTERVAELVGFKFDATHRQGGYFSVYELELIAKALEGKREDLIQVLVNLDDVVSAVGFKKLRDEYNVGRCLMKIYELMNKALGTHRSPEGGEENVADNSARN